MSTKKRGLRRAFYLSKKDHIFFAAGLAKLCEAVRHARMRHKPCFPGRKNNLSGVWAMDGEGRAVLRCPVGQNGAMLDLSLIHI